MKTVLCNGCFDVLHIGHVEHLNRAAELGDSLIVSLTVDNAVNKGPGRPINKWSDRAAVLLALRVVDGVIPTSSAVEAIRKVKPSVFCKGIDYSDGKQFTEDIAGACNETGAVLHFTYTAKRSVTQIIKDANERDSKVR